MLELARLGVATRPGYPRERLDAVLRAARAARARAFFEFEPVPVSSTEIRARVARGEPIDGARPAGGGAPDRAARPLPAARSTSAARGYTGGRPKDRDLDPDSNKPAASPPSPHEKLAKDVVILDMRPVCTYTDFFVVCTGQNPRQTKAIFDEVLRAAEAGRRACCRASVEGEREATWIIADYLDVVLHVFTPEARDFYRLEELWGDVPSVAGGGRGG